MLEAIRIDTKKYRKLNPGNTSIVKVYWRDITDSLEEYPCAARCLSVGFLLEDSDDYTILAHNWDEIEGWSGWSTILAGAVDNIVGANFD